MSAYYNKSAIETAILNALSPLSVGAGGYLMELSVYKGELSLAGVCRETLRMPSLLLSYSGSTYNTGPYLYAEETITYNLIALCRTGVSPNAYKLLEDVRDKLCGSSLGLDIKPLKLLREISVESNKEFTTLSAIYSLTQKVSLLSQER